MSRSRFTVSDFGRCVAVNITDGSTIEYHIPYTSSGEGYVRVGSNVGHQLCDAMGNALTATPETLLQTIRAYWRKAQRARRY